MWCSWSFCWRWRRNRIKVAVENGGTRLSGTREYAHLQHDHSCPKTILLRVHFEARERDARRRLAIMTKALASLGGIFCVTLVVCLSGVLLSTATLETTKARTRVDNITGERSIESASDASITSILPAGWDERGNKMW